MYVIVIAHSWGAKAAARVVAEGAEVDKLVTVDAVSRRRPDFRRVAENVGVWHNYDSSSRRVFDLSNIIGWIGGPWNDAPEDFANSHDRRNLTHAGICAVYCEHGDICRRRRLKWPLAAS